MEDLAPYNLFLDDERSPEIVADYIGSRLEHYYRFQQWYTVRSHKQFVETVEKFGVPKWVSFDHDLAPEHYRPSMYDKDEHYNNYYADGTFKTETGYHTAMWLINHIEKNNLPLPLLIICHSMNPLGRKNINKMFREAKERRDAK